MVALSLNLRMDRVLRNLALMFLVGVAMVVVAQVGERLGWWNGFGLWATGAGLILSILFVAIAIVYSSTKPQVASIALSVHAGNEMMVENNRMQREHGEKLDRVIELLRDIRDRL